MRNYSFSLERQGVPHYLVQCVTSLYQSCRTVVSVEVKLTHYFSVKVGVPQGLTLKWLLDGVFVCIRFLSIWRIFR